MIGLQRSAQSQLIGSPVCTACIDPAMHGAIGLFGPRVAQGQVYGELQVEARLAQQQPGGKIGRGESGFWRDAVWPQFFLSIDEPPPQRADAGVRLPAIVERIRGLGRCTPAKMEPGCQRVAAALLIKATLRQAQAQRRM
jgi:hypothetical protein